MTVKASYAKWKARLAGETVPTFTEPGVDDCGFYRLPVLERKKNAAGHNNGQWKRIGWKPVALYVINDDITGSELVAMIGDQTTTHFDAWPSFSQHPISEDLYRRVAEKGEPWPDEADTVPAADRAVTVSDNEPPAAETPETHATAIDNAIAAAVKTVANEEDAAKALGSKNRIAELRLAADKAGKAIYDPPYREYVKLRDSWTAPVKRATDAEAKLNKMYLTWQESERKRLAKEAEEAAAKLDIAATPEPVAAPVAVAPTYGKKAPKLEPKKFAVINDYATALAYFHQDPELRERVEKLATDAVRAGKAVPGTTTREGLI